MAYQPVDIGSAPNDGTGDPIRDAFDKVNDNFVEVYAATTGLLDFKGSTDCSANPNYPAASKGDFYLVSVAGKIGGASGTDVTAGDSYFALADNAGGTQAAVGTSWTVIQGNVAYVPVNKAGDTMTGDLIVPDEAYDATTWNASLEVPTKNAIRDKIESLAGGVTTLDGLTDVNAPTPSNNDVLTWDSTPGEWVAAAGGGGGGYTPGGTDVALADGGTGASLVDPGADRVLFWDDSAGTIEWLTLGTNLAITGTTLNATGGGAWALAGTGQTATGVWDQAVDGSKATVDFAGLAGFTDIMIIVRNVTQANSGVIQCRVSVDNGSTYYASSGDYVLISVNGVESNDTYMAGFWTTNATAARSGVVTIPAAGVANVPRASVVLLAASLSRYFVASNSAINAVRVLPSAGGNLTGGKIYCLVR